MSEANQNTRRVKLTDEQHVALCADWDALYAKHRDVLTEGDYVLDTLMLALAATVERERDQQAHPLVIACLDNCIDGLRGAAFDYYVSTK